MGSLRLFVFVTVLALLVPAAPAQSNPNLPIIVAAHNGSVQVAGLSDGSLVWRQAGALDWKSANLSLPKNGVSHLTWDGRQFVATGFFSVARSTDGRNWSLATVPAGRAFDPGNIISDSEFFKRGSKSANQIQSFLNSKVSQCQSGYVCLKDFREKTFDRASSPMCRAYKSPGIETAAQIIARVSEACGVSAEVLLVLLQKEQSLVTHTAPSSTRFQRATGYACPDTAPCNSLYFGFYNQVYNAARQFQRYSNPPGTSRFFTWYRVGSPSDVLYHPNSACGRAPTVIRNQATAGLYYYTPYVPNAASIRAFSGLGDSCSSYGNRNFWRIYNLWFSTTRDYQTWFANSSGVRLVIDRDGSVARGDNNVSSWSVGTRLPGTTSKRVQRVGNLSDGRIAVVRDDGRIFVTSDGLRWDSINSSVTLHESGWILPVINGEIMAGPPAPSNLTVSITDDVVLSWTRPADIAGSPVLSYTLFLLDKKGRVIVNQEVPATEAQTESFRVSESPSITPILAVKRQYRFAVSARNQFGEGARSKASRGGFQVTPPGPPQSLSISADGGMTAWWSSPRTSGGAPVEGYRVHLLNAKGKLIATSETLIPQDGGSNVVKLTELSFSGQLQSGTNYRLAVTALTRFGESARPNNKRSVRFQFVEFVEEVPPTSENDENSVLD